MMEQQQHDKEDRLIDRYLDGSLTGVERQEFIDRMDAEVAFREAVAFRNLLTDGIRLAADDEIKAEVIESINYHKPRLPFGLRMLLVFLGILAGGILLFNYVGNDRVIRKPVITFKWFTGKKEKRTDDKDQRKNEARTPVLVAEDSSQSGANPGMDSATASSEQTGDSIFSDGALMAGESEIVVRKDQLIFSATLTPKLVSRAGEVKSAAAGSLAEETARKLNPPADLPEAEMTTSYDVECWISPVNYHGFRMVLNKIQLYGLEQPEKIKLFKSDKRLFLRCGNELYEIMTTDQFQPYRLVRDVELLNVCR